mgnify:CR=1 FL=1
MRKRKINTKEGSRYPVTSFVLLGILGVVSVFLAIEIATSGAKLASLELEEKRLIRENEVLKSELVNASSLSQLGKGAEELGFSKPASILYITDEKDVARLP